MSKRSQIETKLRHFVRDIFETINWDLFNQFKTYLRHNRDILFRRFIVGTSRIIRTVVVSYDNRAIHIGIENRDIRQIAKLQWKLSSNCTKFCNENTNSRNFAIKLTLGMFEQVINKQGMRHILALMAQPGASSLLHIFTYMYFSFLLFFQFHAFLNVCNQTSLSIYMIFPFLEFIFRSISFQKYAN